MMLWQLDACIDGWNKVHGGEPKPEPMSDERFDEMMRKSGYSIH